MIHTLLTLLADVEPWFSNRDAGLIGGLGGAGVGVIGGLLGALSGVLAPRGVGRGFVLGTFKLIIVLALATLGVGVYALAVGQPYHVWFPLTLIGFVPTVVMAGILPALRRQYDAAEQRKMDADALRRS